MSNEIEATGALAWFNQAVCLAPEAERILNSKDIELSYYHIIKLIIEAQKVEVLNGAFNSDCEDDNAPLSRIANALSASGEDSKTSVIKELFEIKAAISLK